MCFKRNFRENNNKNNKKSNLFEFYSCDTPLKPNFVFITAHTKKLLLAVALPEKLS